MKVTKTRITKEGEIKTAVVINVTSPTFRVDKERSNITLTSGNTFVEFTSYDIELLKHNIDKLQSM